MNQEIKEKYLPLGTVCLLKGATKRVMITGFFSMAADDKEKIYDYSGCMFPEGFLSSEQTALFNHEQIERVDYLGLVDEEVEKFHKGLKILISNIDKANLDTSNISNVETLNVDSE